MKMQTVGIAGAVVVMLFAPTLRLFDASLLAVARQAAYLQVEYYERYNRYADTPSELAHAGLWDIHHRVHVTFEPVAGTGPRIRATRWGRSAAVDVLAETEP